MLNRWATRLFWLLTALIVVTFVTLVGFRLAAQFRETGSAEALAPAQGQRVATSKGELFVQIRGADNQQPVLLIHGAGAWSGFWIDAADALARNRFKVIAVDLPPFGFSERSLTDAYSVVDQAARISELLTALKLPPALIVGHSFGAGAVMETVLRYPNQLRGVVLICGALGLPADDAVPVAARLPWIVKQSVAMELIVATTATNPLLTRSLTAMMLHRKAAADDRQVAILQRPLGLRGSTAALTAWLPSLLGTDMNALSSVPVNYRNITLPTALIWGREDTVTPLAQGEQLKRLIPNATLEVIDQVGHIPHIEDPKRTLEQLVAVLAKM